MRTERVWSHISLKLVALLLVLTVPPAATLAWLGYQLFAQDRELLASVVTERRRAELQTVIGALEQAVVGAERLLASGDLPVGMVRLTFSAGRAEVFPADGALWLPVPTVDRAKPAAALATAQRLELGGESERARALYESGALAASRATQASALLGLARVHRRAGRVDEAIGAYRRLAGLGLIDIVDAPAELQARRAIVSVLEEAGRVDAAAREAAELRALFLAGRWTLDWPAWDLTAKDLERWTGEPVPRPADRERTSIVASLLWEQGAPVSGPQVARSTVAAGEVVSTVLSRSNGRTRTALVISPAVVQGWLDNALARTPAVLPPIALLDREGLLIAGATLADVEEDPAWPATATSLPWAIATAPRAGSSEELAFARRRQQLVLALAAILALLTGGSYFLWRVVQRELAVGRLQTEFVAAVSHEFRTPLTSLRHVTDLLEETDDLPRERRNALYGAFGRNVDRLQRLVESLLDFSRMEGGRKPYDFQPVDAGGLVSDVVEAFGRDVAPAGVRMHLEVDSPGPLLCRGDTAALSTALWNMLDNAVKYSPDRRDVYVSVRRHPAGLAIAVRDEGLGIPAREQKEIFQRFVRGEQARRLGIKGTGLGLAMVAHVARAHGGVVEMESTEGAGSTFRLVLPALT